MRNAPNPPIDRPEINRGDSFFAPFMLSYKASGTSSAIHFSKLRLSTGKKLEPSPHKPSEGMARIIRGSCPFCISSSALKCTPDAKGQLHELPYTPCKRI